MQKLDDAIAHMTLLAMVADTVLTRLREGFDAALAPWLCRGVISIKKRISGFTKTPFSEHVVKCIRVATV